MLTNCLATCAHLSITVCEIERDICEKIVILSYPLAFDAPVRGVHRLHGFICTFIGILVSKIIIAYALIDTSVDFATVQK